MYNRCARVFCSISQVSAAFLWRHIKLKEFQLLHTTSLNVSSKTVDKSEDPGGRASCVSYYLHTATWQRRHFTLCFCKHHSWTLHVLCERPLILQKLYISALNQISTQLIQQSTSASSTLPFEFISAVYHSAIFKIFPNYRNWIFHVGIY